ncbi:MAG TPA: EamA family transporter [Gemmatimonadaceae bacterium]|nr:EamA family transporter [Gemmatimonadaceae bacterium]
MTSGRLVTPVDEPAYGAAAGGSNEPTYPRTRVIAAFVAVYIVWGSTYLAIRYAVQTIPPFFMVGARFVVSGAILYLWSRLRGSPRPTRREWRDAAIAGGLMLGFGNGSVAWAELRVPSGLAALLVAVVPLWMVLLDWAGPRGRRPRGRVMLGVVVGLAGLFVLVNPGASVGGREGGIDLVASIVLILSSLGWAAGSVYNRYGARPRSAAMSTGMQMLAGSIALLVIGAAIGEPARLHPTEISAASWIGWTYLVTFGSLIGFTAYIYLLQAVSPAKASTYAYVNPLVAVFLGWAIAGEPVTARTLIAAAIILAGVAMITMGARRGDA